MPCVCHVTCLTAVFMLLFFFLQIYFGPLDLIFYDKKGDRRNKRCMGY